MKSFMFLDRFKDIIERNGFNLVDVSNVGNMVLRLEDTVYALSDKIMAGDYIVFEARVAIKKEDLPTQKDVFPTLSKCFKKEE